MILAGVTTPTDIYLKEFINGNEGAPTNIDIDDFIFKGGLILPTPISFKYVKRFNDDNFDMKNQHIITILTRNDRMITFFKDKGMFLHNDKKQTLFYIDHSLFENVVKTLNYLHSPFAGKDQITASVENTLKRLYDNYCGKDILVKFNRNELIERIIDKYPEDTNIDIRDNDNTEYEFNNIVNSISNAYRTIYTTD